MSEAVEQLARQGFARLRTGVREPWMLANIGTGLGAPVGTELWGDEFEVEFDPHHAGAGGSIARRRAPFPLHTDGSFQRNPPRYVLLQCVESDAPGFGHSRLLDVEHLVPSLPGDSLKLLCSISFEFRRQAGATISAHRAPIIEQAQEWHRIRYRRDDNFSLAAGSPHAAALLEAFEDAVLSCKETVEMFLEPGDILVIDNLRCLHGRSALSGTRRRLLRRTWIA